MVGWTAAFSSARETAQRGKKPLPARPERVERRRDRPAGVRRLGLAMFDGQRAAPARGSPP